MSDLPDRIRVWRSFPNGHVLGWAPDTYNGTGERYILATPARLAAEELREMLAALCHGTRPVDQREVRDLLARTESNGDDK